MRTSDPMRAMRQYIDAFNRHDARMMAAMFSAPGSIEDGMEPEAWQGPTAALDWYRGVAAESGRYDASDYSVTLGPPLHNTITITGDRAFVVVPATMTFKRHGTEVTQTGAQFTAALRKVDGSWRIGAWAWSNDRPQ